MRNAGLDEAQAGIKISWRNINMHPYGRKQRRTKEPLDESERGSEEARLKLNSQKTKIMASGLITSWQIDGETMETVTDFILGAPKLLQMVIATMKLKDAYSLEGSRDITLPTKVHLVKAMVFPVVMNGYESWTVKKVEH